MASAPDPIHLRINGLDVVVTLCLTYTFLHRLHPVMEAEVPLWTRRRDRMFCNSKISAKDARSVDCAQPYVRHLALSFFRLSCGQRLIRLLAGVGPWMVVDVPRNKVKPDALNEVCTILIIPGPRD